MKEITIEAASRQDTGKGVARKLRAAKKIPAVVYGKDEKPLPLTLEYEHFHKAYHALYGQNALINLKIDGRESDKKALIRDIQHDPVYGDILHVDFQNITMGQKIHISVPIRLNGTAKGVKTFGGILQWSVRQLDIACVPSDVPDYIEIDISDLNIGDAIHIDDLNYPNIEIKGNKRETIVTVVAPTVSKIKETEGAEGEEGEEAPAAVDEQAEPEVISEKKAEERQASKEKE